MIGNCVSINCWFKLLRVIVHGSRLDVLFHCFMPLSSYRQKLADFLARMVSAEGSFRMHEGGEVDIRGTYCAVAVARLCRLSVHPLMSRTPSWILQSVVASVVFDPFCCIPEFVFFLQKFFSYHEKMITIRWRKRILQKKIKSRTICVSLSSWNSEHWSVWVFLSQRLIVSVYSMV